MSSKEYGMPNFESHIEKILAELQLKDRQRNVDAGDYRRIKNRIVKRLCETVEFKMIFGGLDFFGRTSFHVPIDEPDDKDAILVLNMPGNTGMKVELSKDCPGFVTLDYSEGLQKLRSCGDPSFALLEKLVDPQTKCLDKLKLQKWLQGLFEKVFESFPKARRAKGNNWSLHYEKHNSSLTVTASTPTGKEIAIDFVPAIKLYSETWPYCKEKGIFQAKSDYWYACLVTNLDSGENREATKFLVANPRAESLKYPITDKLEEVFLLLKAIRKKNCLYGVKNYHVMTQYYWNVGCSHFWKRHSGEIFIWLIDKLYNDFNQQKMRYFWDDQMNLLKNFEGLSHYPDILLKLYRPLPFYQKTLDQYRFYFGLNSAFRSNLIDIFPKSICDYYRYNYTTAGITYHITTILKEKTNLIWTHSCAELPITFLNEGDMMLEMKFPGVEWIKAKPSKDCPGFVSLDYSKALQQLRSEKHRSLQVMERLVHPETECLSIVHLQQWLEDLFGLMFQNGPILLEIQNTMLSLQYSKHNEAFKVTATRPNGSKVSVDFGIGILLFSINWPDWNRAANFESTSDIWYACPASIQNKDETLFQTINTLETNGKLRNNHNLWPACCLLNAFLTKKNLYTIKVLCLTTLFLNEIDIQNRKFWKQDVDIIFLYMFGKLIEALENGHLSYYWDNKMNLLENLSSSDIVFYKTILQRFYEVFQSYRNDPCVTLEQCEDHFSQIAYD